MIQVLVFDFFFNAKKFFINPFLLWLIFSFPAIQSSGQNLTVHANATVFDRPEDHPYAELYIKIPAQSLAFTKQKDNTYQGKLNIHLIYFNENDTSFNQNYKLLTRKVKDSSRRNFFIYELKRTALPPAVHRLELSIQDLNNDSNQVNNSWYIDTRFPQDTMYFSGIELLDTVYRAQEKNRFTRGSYQLVPNVLNYFTPLQNNLYFYVELYRLKKYFDKKVYLRYSILKNGKTFPGGQKTVKIKPRMVNILNGHFRIDSLPEGYYGLNMQLFNRNQPVLEKQVNFYRKASIKKKNATYSHYDPSANFAKTFTRKELKTYFDYLFFISSHKENQKIEKLLGEGDSTEWQEYFYRFWTQRDPANPKKAWTSYLARVNYVNERFGTSIQKGFETDRGRVYLTYGPPNNIVRSIDDPNSYPYQIWTYYSTPRQSNVKFIFYNRTLMPKDYVLLHSNATGELHNNEWPREIKSRTQQQPGQFMDFGSDPEEDFNK